MPLAFCLLPPAFCLAAVAATPPPAAAPDIRDIVAPQPYYISGNYWLLLVATGCVLGAVAVAWVLLRSLRRPKVVVPPTPHEVAHGRLDALRARADQTDPRAFGEEAADVLRVFIGAQYQLRAQRQTSPEFLDSVRGSTLFSTPQHSVLADFLNQCDLLKFARQDATRPDKLKLLEQAAVFLDADPKQSPALTPNHAPPRTGTGAPAFPSAHPPPLPPPTRYPYESPEARYMPPGMQPPPVPTDESAASSAAP